MHSCKFKGDGCFGSVELACTRRFVRSAGDLPLAVFLVTRTHALDALPQSLFLQQFSLMLTGGYFLFRWVTSAYLLRVRTRDDVSLPPDVSAPPDVLPGATSPVLFSLCCRALVLVCQILVYLNFGSSLVFK